MYTYSDIRQIYDGYLAEANSYAQQFGLDPSSMWNGEWDAFRHAYASAAMTQDFGESIARIAGELNEIRGDLAHDQPPDERNMDMWNNAVGREVGNTPATRGEIANRVKDALDNGDLIRNPSDSRRYDDLGNAMDLEGWTDYFNQAEQPPSPIVLDLDGDGVETIAEGFGVYFDHKADGFAESTGWVAADDGLLVMYRDGDGRIGSGRELFNLSEVGIKSIGTSYSDSSFVDANGNEHRQVGGFTRLDDTTGTATDVWFKVNPTRTVAEDWLPVPSDVSALPDLQGMGQVYDLHQAMARDTSGELESLVQSFGEASEVSEREALLGQILVRWAAAEDIDPQSNRGWFNARKLHIMEAFAGRGYYAAWIPDYWGVTPSDPLSCAVPALEKAYDRLFETYYAGLMMQTHLRDLFGSATCSWNAEAQIPHIDLTGVAQDLQTSYSADPTSARTLISEMTRSLVGSGLYRYADLEGFASALVPLAPDIGEMIGAWTDPAVTGIALCGTENADDIVGTIGADTLLGWSGNSSINGGIGSDYIAGYDGDDVLYGGAGIDTLLGGDDDDAVIASDGDDWLAGDAGNDTLEGGAGNDIYAFGRGGGVDRVEEGDLTTGNVDVAQFLADIAPDQLWFRHVGDSLEVSVIGSSDVISIAGWYSGSAFHVEQFKTADNKLLIDTRVENLVAAMAAFSPPPAYQTALAPVLAANWQ
jgi:hypothetical protein